jgi:hypothetical protein
MLLGLPKIHVHLGHDHLYGLSIFVPQVDMGFPQGRSRASKNPTYEGGPNVFHGWVYGYVWNSAVLLLRAPKDGHTEGLKNSKGEGVGARSASTSGDGTLRL